MTLIKELICVSKGSVIDIYTHIYNILYIEYSFGLTDLNMWRVPLWN